MKKNFILAGFVILALASQAQWSTSCPVTANCSGFMNTTSTNGGLTITQNGLDANNPGSAVLRLVNNTTGGHDYVIGSTGVGNTQGSGHFSIYDFTNAANGGPGDRLLIEGSTGNVGINTTAPAAKLHVVETGNANAVYAIQSDLTMTGGNGGTSIVGSCTGSGSGNLTGIFGLASAATINAGGFFTGNGGGTGTTAYGVCGTAFLGEYNYGVYGSIGGGQNGGTNPPTPNLYYNAGYFNGDVVTTSSAYYFSDKRLKKDIFKIDNSLTLINKLNPVTYNFDTESTPYIALPREKQYGFISQEVKEILPELTKVAVHPAQYDKKTGKEISPKKEVLGLNYNGFIAILTKGIQEQQLQIEALKEELQTLKSGKMTGINQVSGVDGFALEQNIPNPFSNETVIKYTLPQQYKNASLVVYDLSGKQISSFPLTEKDSASITITSEKLAAGIYIYSVMADGKILDSKRMIVANK